jgi:hypothetical protein
VVGRLLLCCLLPLCCSHDVRPHIIHLLVLLGWWWRCCNLLLLLLLWLLLAPLGV